MKRAWQFAPRRFRRRERDGRTPSVELRSVALAAGQAPELPNARFPLAEPLDGSRAGNVRSGPVGVWMSTLPMFPAVAVSREASGGEPE